MRFVVHEDVFEKLPDVCFGVVAARGIDNTKRIPAIDSLLDDNVNNTVVRLKDTELKQYPAIAAYRDAFTRLGINPNKFQCSIEALMKRVLKGGEFPKINSVVDLGNAVSVKYIIPIGAHDLDKSDKDIEIRFSGSEDIFLPFGAGSYEKVDPGELVYARGNTVKTRRWIWRQSEDGKITGDSSNIFFPIDGFKGSNHASVIAARDELAKLAEGLFGCRVAVGFVDSGSRIMEL